MDKVYKHQEIEKKWYDLWEKSGYFTPKIIPSKKPFTIILPLPNANDPMHMGHALFTIQDIMVRYHRMLGDPTLWLPGGDHAGIETQFVFEKKLAKEDKSRFDFDRETLYRMIAKYVDENKNINKDQMKLLGFSLDWNRYHFSLEPDIVAMVLNTFRKLHEDRLIYRAQRLVNYCTKCGTAFSDLEIKYVEKNDQLYFLDYGPIRIATTRPETIFADTAVAVNPKDKRYKKIIAEKAIIPLIDKQIPIIADEAIEISFGTGALKVTPAHDAVDYEIGQRHLLPVVEIIDLHGRMKNLPEKYRGLKVNKARELVTQDLKDSGKLIKTEPLIHNVATCYRCNSTIEPMLIPQWYIKTKPLARPAIEAVKTGKTKIVPKKRFEKLYFDWMNNIMDWNISRQIVWGPRIPAYYCLDCNKNISVTFLDKNSNKVTGLYKDLSQKYTFKEISEGLQSLTAPLDATYALDKGNCPKCKGSNVIQETDTFDTWFLSGQWPVNTLRSIPGDLEYFYPTSVLDTLWDILFFWVARMMMMGLYLTGKVPFEVVHIHARVTDKLGQKMAKSKGNVINPIDLSSKFGADALRFSLVYGTAPASDISISEDKVIGMRNFANKLWNIGRFIEMNTEIYKQKKIPISILEKLAKKSIQENDKKIISETKSLTGKITKLIENYRFGQAAEELYEFVWHRLADIYLEEIKERLKNNDTAALSVLRHVYLNSLKLLHPFMPFITEEINSHIISGNNTPLIVSAWPKS